MVGPLGHWEGLRAYQLAALRQQGLAPHHRLLDLGCGPLQGGIAFIRYLNERGYVGVDLDPVKLSEGYRQIWECRLASKNPRLLISRSFGGEELGAETFDYVWASQVLYYFDQEILRRLFDRVSRCLARGGRFLGDILGTCEPEFASVRHQQWMQSVERHTVAQMDELATGFGLRARAVGQIKEFGYPRQLNLRSNLLVEVRRSAEG